MHLAIAEPQYWNRVQGPSLAKPVKPEFKPQATDAGMLVVRHRSDAAHDRQVRRACRAVSSRT